jgi:hypothetical protein
VRECATLQTQPLAETLLHKRCSPFSRHSYCNIRTYAADLHERNEELGRGCYFSDLSVWSSTSVSSWGRKRCESARQGGGPLRARANGRACRRTRATRTRRSTSTLLWTLGSWFERPLHCQSPFSHPVLPTLSCMNSRYVVTAALAMLLVRTLCERNRPSTAVARAASGAVLAGTQGRARELSARLVCDIICGGRWVRTRSLTSWPTFSSAISRTVSTSTTSTRRVSRPGDGGQA